MEILNKIIDLSNEFEDYVIDLRRQIHKNPELSFQEYATSSLVEKELKKLKLDIKSGLAGTGLIARLNGHKKGKTILIRADMDALPIEEEVDIDFKSQNKGVMHACGHDVHTANLLGVARIMSKLKDNFKGQVIFLFQPSEERGGGCKKIIDSGALDIEAIDAALALHLMPIKEGQILLAKGNITAYSDGFTIKVFGKSAHSSQPQDGIDAINIGSHLVVALNSIMAKYLDPREVANFSIGKIQGGRSNNIISDYVEMSGIIRSTSRQSRETIHHRIENISQDIGKSFGGRVEVEIREGYPSIVNNGNLVQETRSLFRSSYPSFIKDIREEFSLGDLDGYVLDHKPLLTADDFGYISQLVPSLYYMVGIGNFAPLHSPNFYVNEDYIKLATRTMTLAALNILNKED